jgi:hypothetical protein
VSPAFSSHLYSPWQIADLKRSFEMQFDVPGETKVVIVHIIVQKCQVTIFSAIQLSILSNLFNKAFESA